MVVLMLAAILLTSGCSRSSKDLIVGTWKITSPASPSSVEVRQFRSDGIVTDPPGVVMQLPTHFRYRVVGDRLSLENTTAGNYAGDMRWEGNDRFVYAYTNTYDSSGVGAKTGTADFVRVK